MSKSLTRKRLGGAVYILPNMLTTGNLFFGFFSIIKTLDGHYWLAAIAILLASIFDVLDGRVARLANATSEFGVQFDSLCDLISFGLAPAFLMYQFALRDLGRVGWVICFLFLACGALRLARFNVQSAIGNADGDFTGLPIPMAAATVSLFVASLTNLQATQGGDSIFSKMVAPYFMIPDLKIWFFLIFGPLLATAMVCNLAYRSHKTLHFSGIRPFQLLVLGVLTVGLTALEPELVGFLFFFIYAISGPIEWLLGWKKPTDEGDIFQGSGENDGPRSIE